jgi:hypothetical protein
LNATKILSTELLIPPLTEQRNIVSYLENLHSEINLLHRMEPGTALELHALLPSVQVRRMTHLEEPGPSSARQRPDQDDAHKGAGDPDGHRHALGVYNPWEVVIAFD